MAVSGLECLNWTEGSGPCASESDTVDTGCPDGTGISSEFGPYLHPSHQNDNRSCGQSGSRALVALIFGLGLRRRRRSLLHKASSSN